MILFRVCGHLFCVLPAVLPVQEGAGGGVDAGAVGVALHLHPGTGLSSYHEARTLLTSRVTGEVRGWTGTSHSVIFPVATLYNFAQTSNFRSQSPIIRQ